MQNDLVIQNIAKIHIAAIELEAHVKLNSQILYDYKSSVEYLCKISEIKKIVLELENIEV